MSQRGSWQVSRMPCTLLWGPERQAEGRPAGDGPSCTRSPPRPARVQGVDTRHSLARPPRLGDGDVGLCGRRRRSGQGHTGIYCELIATHPGRWRKWKAHQSADQRVENGDGGYEALTDVLVVAGCGSPVCTVSVLPSQSVRPFHSPVQCCWNLLSAGGWAAERRLPTSPASADL